MNNLVIVGFPGAGKTTLGRKLSERLHWQFIDLDDAIEAKYHATIPHIFEKYGEFVFRKCEFKTLSDTLEQNNTIISTGGGAPCSEKAMEIINQKSTSIYLKMSEENLIQRLRSSKKTRPLVQKLSDEELIQYVHHTLSTRTPFYEKAHVTIDGNNLDADALADKLANEVL